MYVTSHRIWQLPLTYDRLMQTSSRMIVSAVDPPHSPKPLKPGQPSMYPHMYSNSNVVSGRATRRAALHFPEYCSLPVPARYPRLPQIWSGRPIQSFTKYRSFWQGLADWVVSELFQIGYTNVLAFMYMSEARPWFIKGYIFKGKEGAVVEEDREFAIHLSTRIQIYSAPLQIQMAHLANWVTLWGDWEELMQSILVITIFIKACPLLICMLSILPAIELNNVCARTKFFKKKSLSWNHSLCSHRPLSPSKSS